MSELRAAPTRGDSDGSFVSDDDFIAIVTVTPTTTTYQWSAVSAASDDGDNVVKPDDVPSASPGRWVKRTSLIRFVPVTNGPSYALDQLPPSGPMPVQTVITIDKDLSPEEMVALLTGQMPAVVIAADDDDPEETDLNAGARWRDEFHFTVTVVCENYRDRREAAHGSDVAADGPDLGANKIDGMIWELLAGCGDGRLNMVEDAIVDVRPGRGRNWTSVLAQRRVFRSRSYTIIATIENPPGSGDAGPCEGLDLQGAFTEADSEGVLDLDNLVTLGCSVSLGAGLVKTVKPGTAIVAAAAVSYDGELHTFGSDVDTYRDLNPDGTMNFTAVQIDSDPPALAPGALRVGVTRTDGSGVLTDTFLCGRSENYGNPDELDF